MIIHQNFTVFFFVYFFSLWFSSFLINFSSISPKGNTHAKFILHTFSLFCQNNEQAVYRPQRKIKISKSFLLMTTFVSGKRLKLGTVSLDIVRY